MRTEKYTAKQVIDAIRQAKGIKSEAAVILGCTRRTVHNYCERYATVRQACEDEREKMVDAAEMSLYHKVRIEQYWPAIRYLLSTLGKDRGYVERQEFSGDLDVRMIPLDWGDEDDSGQAAEAAPRPA